MSVRFNASFDTSPIDALLNRLDSINAITEEIGQEVFQQWAPEIEARLKQPPGPSHSPVIWATPKQRRAFFASQGFGGGIPHVRTNELADAWAITYESSSGHWQILVSNPYPAARFVFGSLAKNETAAARFQQPQHKATGWPLATVIVQYYIGVMIEDFKVKFADRLGEFGTQSTKGRAYTTPRTK